jgi:hypothetical protein
MAFAGDAFGSRFSTLTFLQEEITMRCDLTPSSPLPKLAALNPTAFPTDCVSENAIFSRLTTVFHRVRSAVDAVGESCDQRS